MVVELIDALASLPAAALVIDAGDELVWVNARAAAMFAVGAEDVTGHRADTLLTLTGALEKARLGAPALTSRAGAPTACRSRSR